MGVFRELCVKNYVYEKFNHLFALNIKKSFTHDQLRKLFSIQIQVGNNGQKVVVELDYSTKEGNYYCGMRKMLF